MVDERQKKGLGIVMAAVLLVSMYFVAGEGAVYVNSERLVAEEGEKEKFMGVRIPVRWGLTVLWKKILTCRLPCG